MHFLTYQKNSITIDLRGAQVNKTDIDTGVQTSKYYNHNSPVPQRNHV